MANESTAVKGRDGCVFAHLLACLPVCCLHSVTCMNIYSCLCALNHGPVSAACKKQVAVIPSVAFQVLPVISIKLFWSMARVTLDRLRVRDPSNC